MPSHFEGPAQPRLVAVALLAPVLFLLAPPGAAPARAAARWTGQAFVGAAFNLPTPLSIRQEGHDELRLRARYRTRAFELPLYYAARATRWSGSRGWGLDLVHHKLHLENRPTEVESFAVSHGYNLVTLSRSWSEGDRLYGLQAGAVVGHPESTVRGRKLGEEGGLLGTGYHLAGPTLGGVVGRRLEPRRGWFGAVEARITLSYARLPVAGGEADVPNVALHVLVGAGYER